MSNRRHKVRRPKVTRAPPEGASGSGESPEALPVRGFTWRSLLRTIAGLVVALGGALALAYGAHRYALSTPRFALVHVEVEGVKRLTQGELLALAHLELGRNVLRIDLTEVERALLSSPWIRVARAERRLPGTLRLELEEREPRALALLDGQLFLVSERGEVFKPLESNDPRDFPVLSGLDARQILEERGDRQSRLQKGVDLLDEYSHTAIAASFAAEEIHFTPEGHFVLVVGRDGTELYLGLPPFREKLARAERVLFDAKNLGGLPGAVFLDNAAHPERVVVRAR